MRVAYAAGRGADDKGVRSIAGLTGAGIGGTPQRGSLALTLYYLDKVVVFSLVFFFISFAYV